MIVVRTGAKTVDVRLGWPLREDVRFGWPLHVDTARLEVDLYLRVWCAMNQGVRAIRVD